MRFDARLMDFHMRYYSTFFADNATEKGTDVFSMGYTPRGIFSFLSICLLVVVCK